MSQPRPTASTASSARGASGGPADSGAPLAALDRLEAALAALTPGGDTRTRLVSRLSGLLDRLTLPPDDTDGGTGTGTPGAPDVTDQILSATDDDLFDFIDNELGIA